MNSLYCFYFVKKYLYSVTFCNLGLYLAFSRCASICINYISFVVSCCCCPNLLWRVYRMEYDPGPGGTGAKSVVGAAGKSRVIVHTIHV